MVSSTLAAFLTSVVFSILGEIADKTQLVMLGFALKYKSPYKVFLGGLLGHAIMDGIAILIGTFAAFNLQAIWLKYVIAGMFIVLGLYGFWKMYFKKHKAGKEEEKQVKGSSPFWTTFLTILAVEIGDKTQVASAGLAAQYKMPLIIFIGVTVGLAITIGLNVFIGSKFAERLPKNTIKFVTNALFIVFGIISLMIN